MRLIEVEEIKIGFKRDELFTLAMLLHEDITENAVRLFPYFLKEADSKNFDRFMGWLMQENRYGKKLKMFEELCEFSIYSNVKEGLECNIKKRFDEYIKFLDTQK